MPVLRVGKEALAHPRADLREIAQAGHRPVPTTANQIHRATQGRGVADMAVDQQQAPETRALQPIEYLRHSLHQHLR